MMTNKTMMVIFVVFATAALVILTNAERKPSLVGGHRPMDLSSDENKKKVDSLIDFALTELAARRTAELKTQALSSNENPETVKPLAYKAVALKGDVKTQVVAGMNYQFKISMRDANCQEEDVSNCAQEECEMTVWEKPWENFRQLTRVDCKKKSNMVVGGKRKISVKSKEALRALSHAVMKLNAESNDLFYMKPVKVSKVYKQVVNGIKYTIMFTMGRTECEKNTASKLLTHTELSECSLADTSKNLGQERFCKIVVLDQPWMESKTASDDGVKQAASTRYNVMNSECFN